MSDDTKTALLPAARLAEIRAFASAVPPASEWEATIIGHALALLRHLDALAAPADGEALGRGLWLRLARWIPIGSPALRVDITEAAIALDAHGYARGRAEALEGIDRWKMIAEGKDVRIAVLREENARLTAELSTVRRLHDLATANREEANREACAVIDRLGAELAEARDETDRLRQALADARATIVAAPFDDSTIAAVMAAQVKATFDKMLPGLRAELGAQIAERARREGAREEREACARIAEAPHRATRGGGPDDRTRIAAEIRARNDAAPVEDEDGAT